MDSAPALAAPSAADTVTAEQAIFTSVRTPMGSGYRLVAASHGLSDEEKREIVQHAPSHGSLCDESPEAEALASFTLSSGRQCLFLSQNAGVEYSARGGCRVHSRVLVLTSGDFARCACNPLAVRRAARTEIEKDWLRTPPARVEACALLGVNGSPLLLDDAAPASFAPLSALLAAVLGATRLLVTGAPPGAGLASRLFTALPLAARARLSFSYGLRASPSRAFQLVFADVPNGRVDESLRELGMNVWNWTEALPSDASPFRAWCDFAQRRWIAGQHAALDRLACALATSVDAALLTQLAAMSDDLEHAPEADVTELAALEQRYATAPSGPPPLQDLHRTLRIALMARRETLAAKAETDAGCDGSPETAADGGPRPTPALP